MALHWTKNIERLLIGVLALATFTVVFDVSKRLNHGRTEGMLRSGESPHADEHELDSELSYLKFNWKEGKGARDRSVLARKPAAPLQAASWGFHAADPSMPQAPSFAPANKPHAQAFEIRAFELRAMSANASNGTNTTTVPTPTPSALPYPSPTARPIPSPTASLGTVAPTESFASGDSVYVTAESTMTTYWAETRATFNNEYTGPFKSAMVKSSGYLTELSQVTNVYANLTSSTRRKLLSTISIDVSFTITIDLTSLGLTASDATSAVTSFTENLIQSMNATDNTSFAYSFLYAAAVAGLDWNITFYPDVEATAATLETMTSSINVVTQPPTKAPTKAPTKKPTPSPTTGPTTSVITTSGVAGWMPSYLVALICVCLSGWQLLKH